MGIGALAIGSRSLAYADGSNAIGTLAYALGKGATAFGTETRAEGISSMAMGNSSYVFADNAIAAGSNSQVLAEGGNAYGYRTYAGGKNSLAMGSNAYANVLMDAVQYKGKDVFGTNNTNGSNIMYNTDPSHYAKSILTGLPLNNKFVTSPESSSMITNDGLEGSKSYLDNLETFLTANTAGPGLTYAKATTQNLHDIDGIIQAKNENAIVIGSNSFANANNGIALGHGAIVRDAASNSMALGSYSMTSGANSIALGLASRATGANSMAVGTASSASAKNGLSVGIAAINAGENSSVVGFASGVAPDAMNSMVFGANSIITKNALNSIVIGTESSIGSYLMADDSRLYKLTSGGQQDTASRAIESYNDPNYTETMSGTRKVTVQGADGSTTEKEVNVSIQNAMAIGYKARVYNKEALTAVEAVPTTLSTDGQTLAHENGNNAMAIGNGARAWLENSVALGVNSETDYTPTQMATIAWRTPGAVAAVTDVNTGVISIGSKGVERRIVNVAAGAYDTDAVNVSQLMQLWDSVQREVNPIDLNKGVHFLGTNFQQIGSTPETDYAKKYAAQVTYDRFIRTLSEYKGYLIKGEYAGSKLTEKADASYRSDLTKLRNDLVNKYGVSLDQLNSNSQLNSFYGKLVDDGNGGVKVDLDVSGLQTAYSSPEEALDALVKARDTDLAVLTKDGTANFVTNMTSSELEQKLDEINYDNSQALTEGSIAIGYNARVGEKTTDSTGATAIKGQKGGVAIGYEARNMAETDNPNGASIALGDKSIVTENDLWKLDEAGKPVVENGNKVVAEGVYYTNEKGTGITATPNAGVVSVGTSTATTTADGITYNPSTRRIINVAAGALDTDAVNVSQLKSLAAQTIKFTTNGITTASGEGETETTTSNAATDAVKVGTENGMNFSLKGADNGKDITTTASGTDVTFTLNKATTVTDTGDDADKAVTSGAVKTAITTVENTINDLNGKVTTNTSSIGTLNNQMAHTIGVTGNTTPSNTSNAKSLTTGDISFAINGDGTDITTTTTATGVRIAVDKTGKVAAGDTKLVTGDTVNTAITNAKNAATTTLTEHADSPITVTKTTAVDGHSNYNVTFNGTKAAEQIPLAYKANGANNTTTSTVTLSNGLNFTNTDNLTASVEANGVVKYTLNKALTGISSISNTATSGDTTTGTTITLSPTSKEVNVAGAKITGLADGENGSDAVNVSQLNNLKNKVGYENAVSSKTDKTPGAAGKDGLDGKDLGTQIAAIREGEAGPMIYTDGEGNRVVKDSDNFYKASDLVTKDGTHYDVSNLPEGAKLSEDGSAIVNSNGEPISQEDLTKAKDAARVDSSKIQVSAVDPKTGEPKAPTTIGNVKSTIGLDGNVGTDGKTPVIGEDQAKTNVSNLVKGDSKTSLNTVATVGDLQAAAQAGLDFTGNSYTTTHDDEKNQDVKTLDTAHTTLGGTIAIQGGAEYKESEFSDKNISTKVDAATDTITITMKDTPEFKGVDLVNDGNTVKLTPGKDTNNRTTLNLTNGTDGKDNQVKITNVAAGTAPNDAVNYSQLENLDNQVKELQNGENGPMVYTDGEGNRVVKDGDNFYKASDLVTKDGTHYDVSNLPEGAKLSEDGSAIVNSNGEPISQEDLTKAKDAARVDSSKIQVSAVDPTTGEPKAPTTIGNVKSNYGYNGIGTELNDKEEEVPAKGIDKAITPEDAKKAMNGVTGTDGTAKGGLLNAKGADLNTVATVGDLQAVAQAGLDFKGNTGDAIHKTLGSTLFIEGAADANFDDGSFESKNLATKNDGGTLRIGMKKSPEFTGITLNNNSSKVVFAPDKDGAGNTSLKVSNGDTTPDADTRVIIDNIKDGESLNSAVTKGALDKAVEELHNREGVDNGTMVYTHEGKTLDRDGNNFYEKGSIAPDKAEKIGTTFYSKDAMAKDGVTISVEGKVIDKDGNEITNPDILSNYQVKPVDPSTIEISTVDPATGEPKAPQTISSVKSNYGYNGIGTELNDKGEKVPAKGANTFITKGDAQKAMGSVDKDGKVISEGLLTAKGADLNKVATVGDLQAAAQAGLDFSTNDKDNKEQTIHRALGSKLSIKGKLDRQYSADYDSDNLVTTVADDNTIQIAMLRKPAFEGITVENGTDGGSGKVDITAVPVNGKDATEGMTINLAGKDGKNGTAGNNGDIRISGVADGVSGNDAVNYSQLKDLIDKVGAVNANAGSDAKSPANTPAGQDGLDGKDMGSQIQAIRDGEAGPMVYTDKDGNRLVNDGGTYYKKSDLAGMEKAGDSYYNTEALEKAGAKIVGGRIVNADGKVLEGDELKKVQDAAKVTTMPKAVNANDVQISTVDPKTGEPKAPTTIGNVKSNYGYNGIGTEADGKTPAKGIVNAITPKDAKTAMNGAKDTDGTVTGGLLNAKGADLNKVVTVGDLQAAAQAGLDFTGNSYTTTHDDEKNQDVKTLDTAHTTLGGTIAIQGGAEYKESEFSDKNISTKVDPKTNTISINIKKNPEFDSVILGQPGENGQPDKQVTISTANGNEVNFTSTHPQDGDTNVVLSGIKDDPARRDTAITRGALEDLGILEGEVGPSHIAGSDVGGNLSNGDNLNDYSLTKQVQAQREGLSGNVVYTDAKGNRLVKAGNRFYSAAPLNKYILESKLRQDPLTGMWFNISDFDEDNKVKEDAKGNGLTAEQLAKKAGVSETQVSDIKLSAVNMSGDTNTPTEIGNIKSTIGLNGTSPKLDDKGQIVRDDTNMPVMVPSVAISAKDAKTAMNGGTDGFGVEKEGLLNVSGSQLNTVATVGDLQAVAQAGLDFKANNNSDGTKNPLHRTLGSEISIKGADVNDGKTFAPDTLPNDKTINDYAFNANNIMTQVQGNVIRIGMKSAPEFTGVNLISANQPTLRLENKDGHLMLTEVKGDVVQSSVRLATQNDGFYIKDANGNKTLVRINNEDAIEFNKYLTVTKADPKSDDTSATGNTGTTGSTGSGTSTGENVNAGTTTGGNTTGGNTSGASTSDTTPKAVGTVDVVVKDVPTEAGDIANKKYVDKQIGDIIKNFNTKNELEGQGTIATNTSTDKLAVSGVTVKQYLDDNYMTRPEINRRFTEVSKQANAGTAAAMAAAGIPQVTNMYDDNLMIGAGAGSYGGESAVAIGVSGTNDDRDITYKIATTYDSRGKWGLSAGIGFSVGSGRDNPTKPERKTMSERIDRLTEENKELRKANEDTLKALDEANKNHLMSLEAANKAQLAQLQESGQAKIDVINATSQAKLDAMKKANEAELDALRKANKAELDKLRASNQAEIKSLTEKNNQLQQQVEKLEAMMNQLMAQNQAKETTAAPTTK